MKTLLTIATIVLLSLCSSKSQVTKDVRYYTVNGKLQSPLNFFQTNVFAGANISIDWNPTTGAITINGGAGGGTNVLIQLEGVNLGSVGTLNFIGATGMVAGTTVTIGGFSGGSSIGTSNISVMVDGVIVASVMTNLNFVTGTNITPILATNASGHVSIQFNLDTFSVTNGLGGGSGGGLTTNEFQFLGVPLSIIEGAFFTNTIFRSPEGGHTRGLMVNTNSLVVTNGFIGMGTDNPVVSLHIVNNAGSPVLLLGSLTSGMVISMGVSGSVGTSGDDVLAFSVNSANKWRIQDSSLSYAFEPVSSNTYDFGVFTSSVRTNYANRFDAKEGIRIGNGATGSSSFEHTNAIPQTNIYRWSVNMGLANQVIGFHNVQSIGSINIHTLTNITIPALSSALSADTLAYNAAVLPSTRHLNGSIGMYKTNLTGNLSVILTNFLENTFYSLVVSNPSTFTVDFNLPAIHWVNHQDGTSPTATTNGWTIYYFLRTGTQTNGWCFAKELPIVPGAFITFTTNVNSITIAADNQITPMTINNVANMAAISNIAHINIASNITLTVSLGQDQQGGGFSQGTNVVDFDISSVKISRMTNDMRFLHSTNRCPNGVDCYKKTQYLVCAGETNRIFHWNANWKAVGTTNAPPIILETNCWMRIDIECWGNNETNVFVLAAKQNFPAP